MRFARPIPEWVPSAPEVRSDTIDEIVSTSPCVAVHFWAPWNGHDVNMDRTLQQIAERFMGQIRFYSCNIDLPENQELFGRSGILNIPALGIWVSGDFRKPIIGCREPDELAAQIELRLKQAQKPWWKLF